MASCCPIVLLSMLLAIEARPTCTINNNIDVVCTPKDKEFKLVRGLVSDRNETIRITLRDCRITDVDFEAFERLPLVTYIDLSVNKIKTLSLGVLDDATRVTHLNLSYNMLTVFPLGLFDQKPKLEVLDLKGNMINNLELGIFDTLTKLKHVDLSYNSLLGKDITPYLFDESVNIKRIDFSGNNMNGSPDNLLHSFQALEILNLDNCELIKVPEFATVRNLQTVKHLVLSSNEITSLDYDTAFGNIDNLEILNLAFNSIERIHENVFKHLSKLKMVILNNNRLKFLHDALFQNMSKLGNINLSHNLIEYVPVNAFRGSGVKNLNLADNRFSYLQDNFLLELRNSGTRLVKFYFNQNPWQCACLIQVLNEVKSMKVKYNNVKYNGKDTVCVANDEFSCKRQPDDNLVFNELYYNNNLVTA